MCNYIFTLTHTNRFPNLKGPGSNSTQAAISTPSINNQVSFVLDSGWQLPSCRISRNKWKDVENIPS